MEAIANLVIDPLANSVKCIGEFLTNFSIAEVNGITACNYVTVRQWEFHHVSPEKFPDKSLHAVSANSITNFFTDCNTEPCA
jgi:hypothetical protein